MNQQKLPDASKLPNRIITSLNCPHALFPINSDTNMCLLNHVYIVCPIPNRHSDFIQVRLDQTNHISLLFRGHSATYHCITRRRDKNEFLSKFFFRKEIIYNLFKKKSKFIGEVLNVSPSTRQPSFLSFA